MAGDTYRQILDYANRADPYPLYAQLRGTPVARQDDGTYVVSTYWEILQLLHDPRLSSAARNPLAAVTEPDQADGIPLRQAFLTLDPPEHDRLRRMVTRPFGPPETPHRINGMRQELRAIITDLIDGFADQHHVDLVKAFSYPFPVTVICRLLGVPPEDEKRFRSWADALVAALDPSPSEDFTQLRRRSLRAVTELNQYMAGLIDARRRNPGDDLLSAIATDRGPDGRMAREDLVASARLLLIAGHETTVNLVTNGMLTLLRHPEVLDRLRHEPELSVGIVEELLRYEPPVQIVPSRTALDDIDIAGTTIAKGAPVMLLLASGNRDPARFPDPDRFDPERMDNEHLGFGHGIHLCFGAPLARLETQLALTELADRLVKPRLAVDPPPYRQSPVLRGPRHLPLDFDDVSARQRDNTAAVGAGRLW